MTDLLGYWATELSELLGYWATELLGYWAPELLGSLPTCSALVSAMAGVEVRVEKVIMSVSPIDRLSSPSSGSSATALRR